MKKPPVHYLVEAYKKEANPSLDSLILDLFTYGWENRERINHYWYYFFDTLFNIRDGSTHSEVDYALLHRILKKWDVGSYITINNKKCEIIALSNTEKDCHFILKGGDKCKLFSEHWKRTPTILEELNEKLKECDFIVVDAEKISKEKIIVLDYDNWAYYDDNENKKYIPLNVLKTFKDIYKSDSGKTLFFGKNL